MLLKLLPEQVPQYWDDIKEGLGRSLPGGGPDRRDLILQGMLLGSIQMWIIYYKRDSEYVIEGGTVTAVIDDPVHGTKNLLSYATWSIVPEGVKRKSWFEMLEALKKYARFKGCNRLVAFSEVPSFIKFAELTGGESRYTFLTWDV